jgi:acetolactate synthase-1/2/3 large subunit
MEQVHGGRLVAGALRRHGVAHAFTLCGAHVQAIYDGCLDESVRVVDTRHGRTAAHAAEGYARVSGIPGVVLATAGPGVTDMVTPLANALRASVPVVCIGGATPRALAGMGAAGELDALSVLRPVTKWAAQVPEASRIVEFVDAAFRAAQTNVPGPVYLEIPLDVLMSKGVPPADDAKRPLLPSRPSGDPAAILQAVELLRKAERPVFVVGSQIRWSADPTVVRRFADVVRVPFLLNGMARGALPRDHATLFAHARRQALAEADLVCVVGTAIDFRFDYGRTPSWNAHGKLIHIDLDGDSLGKNRTPDVAIQGDGGLVLDQLLAAIGGKEAPPWLAALRATEDREKARLLASVESVGAAPTAARIFHELGLRLGTADIVVADGGDFVASGAAALPFEWPRLWLDPGPFGTLGTGPGFGMAAALARPGARTVLLSGDGAFGMHPLEFEAMARQKIPVVALVGNDAAFTQVRRGQVQTYGEGRTVATDLLHTRYDRVVEEVGGLGFWVERAEDIGRALDAAFASGMPACVNVRL